MTGLAGRAAFGHSAGLIAAGVAAVYPNVWLYERELMSEPLALLLVATCIWLSYRFHASPSSRLAFALGITIGSLAMTRADAIVLLLFLVVPLVVKARGTAWRRRVVWLVLAGVGCVLLLAPWVAYNVTAFEHPVLLSTGLGTTMLQGNCDPTYSGRLLGYYRGGLLEACAIEGTFSEDPTIADGQKRRAAIEYMNEHRARVPVVAAARIGADVQRLQTVPAGAPGIGARDLGLGAPSRLVRLLGSRTARGAWSDRSPSPPNRDLSVAGVPAPGAALGRVNHRSCPLPGAHGDPAGPARGLRYRRGGEARTAGREDRLRLPARTTARRHAPALTWQPSCPMSRSANW
jgi:hypothetical protein